MVSGGSEVQLVVKKDMMMLTSTAPPPIAFPVARSQRPTDDFPSPQRGAASLAWGGGTKLEIKQAEKQPIRLFLR